MGFFVIAALGPGLFPNMLVHPYNWQYVLFDVLCHQDPLRSFNLYSHQMAVCARCLGIYSFFLAGWLLFPVFAFFRTPSAQKKKIFLIAVILLNSADVIGNYFGYWSNTLNSRFLLGSFLGLATAFFLADNFFKHKKIGV